MDTEKPCKHKNWSLAGYPDDNRHIRVQSIYEVYCKDCGNFVNLLTHRIINDKGLVRLSWIRHIFLTVFFNTKGD